MNKNALISVYHKEGLTEVARILLEAGWNLFCSDGTARYLSENGLPVSNLSAVTGFADLLSGRVKTLHPAVFSGILAKETEEHQRQLREHGFASFDLVMVNFYPFEEALGERERGLDFMVEKIDVGGPSMVRAAAKNFQSKVVVVDSRDYLEVARELASRGELPLEKRKLLAQKAFAYTSFYDSLIAGYLQESDFGSFFTLAGFKALELRYGENPQQRAALYVNDRHSPFFAEIQLQGKALSYNNLLDAFGVYQVCGEFSGADPFCVIVKHQNPCGAALGESLAEAFRKAWDGDPQSAFGGIAGFNTALDAATAELIAGQFLEVIVAPDYTPEALELLRKKKNLRLLKLPPQGQGGFELRLLSGAFLLQESDRSTLLASDLRLQAGKEPQPAQVNDILFGWKILKYVKSNAIILVKGGQLAGVGAGQMSRVDSVRIAIAKSGDRAAGATLLSDGFFPFADSLELGHQAGITLFVEPGGSVRDGEVVEYAERNGLTLIFTGKRAFRH